MSEIKIIYRHGEEETHRILKLDVPDINLGDLEEKILIHFHLIIYDIDSVSLVTCDDQNIILGEENTKFFSQLSEHPNFDHILVKGREGIPKENPHINNYNKYIALREDEKFARGLQQEEMNSQNQFLGGGQSSFFNVLNSFVGNLENPPQEDDSSDDENDGNDETQTPSQNSSLNNISLLRDPHGNIQGINLTLGTGMNYSFMQMMPPPPGIPPPPPPPPPPGYLQPSLPNQEIQSSTDIDLPDLVENTSGNITPPPPPLLFNPFSMFGNITPLDNNGLTSTNFLSLLQSLTQPPNLEDVKVVSTPEDLAKFECISFKDFKSREQYKTVSCNICLDEYQDDDTIMLLKCNHYFHQDCIKPWLGENSNKCPICREEVSKGKALV